MSEVFVAESNRLQVLTTPSSARILERGAAKQESLSVTQQWRVATNATWIEYVEAVSRALEPRYRCSSAAPQGMLRSRSAPADYLQLELVPEPSASGLVVRARFEARPD